MTFTRYPHTWAYRIENAHSRIGSLNTIQTKHYIELKKKEGTPICLGKKREILVQIIGILNINAIWILIALPLSNYIIIMYKDY